jgi:hypothetical protein
MKTQNTGPAYIVTEQQYHPIVGRLILCPDCHATYTPQDDERTCVMLLTEPEQCDQCQTNLPPYTAM